VLNAGVGTLTISGSTLDTNSAQFGGGLWNRGTLGVNSSILSGNSAAQCGGGIDNVSTLTVNNSTLAGNSAACVGGLFNASGNATLSNATVADNVASIAVGGIDAFPRVAATDIGAFESQGFTISASSGNNQSATVGTTFANPLVVSVTTKNAAEPVWRCHHLHRPRLRCLSCLRRPRNYRR
jgi:hypothetical protein